MAAISEYPNKKDMFIAMLREGASIDELEEKLGVKYHTLEKWWLKYYREESQDIPPLPEDDRGKAFTGNVKPTKGLNLLLSNNFLEGLGMKVSARDEFHGTYSVEDGLGILILKHNLQS